MRHVITLSTVLVSGSSLTFLPDLHAQRLAPLPTGFSSQGLPLAPFQPQLRSSFMLATGENGDYRLEGSVLGAAFLGALGAWVGSESCRNQPTPIGTTGTPSCAGATLTVGFVGAVIGGGIGYLLGRATPKHRRAAPESWD